MRNQCKVDGCARVAHGGGYCWKHYRQMKKVGVEVITKTSIVQRYSGNIELYTTEVSGHSHHAFIQWLYDPSGTPFFSLRKACRAFMSLWASKGELLDEQWVNSWEAKVREGYANHEPSLVIEEGATTISQESRPGRNFRLEAPTTFVRGKDMVWSPTKVGLLP